MVANPIFQPTVLLFHMTDPIRLRRVRACLDRVGVRCTVVPATELTRPLGAILGLPGFPDGPAHFGPDLDEEMLVMFALRDGMLDDLLRVFREECPPTVALKAVATPTNLLWTPRALFDELKQERAWFEQNARPTSAPIQA